MCKILGVGLGDRIWNCRIIYIQDEVQYFSEICMSACVLIQDRLFATYGLWPARLFCPWDSPGKNTEVGCHTLLQGIFSTQGSNLHLLCLLHWQAGSLPLASLGKPIHYRVIINFSPFFSSVQQFYKSVIHWLWIMVWSLMVMPHS